MESLMSKYQEMCEASIAARKKAIQSRDRCFKHLIFLVNGLAKYCEIPGDKITFLLWNEDRGTYREADDGMMHGVPDAAFYNKSDGYWHLGVAITLSPKGSIPENW